MSAGALSQEGRSGGSSTLPALHSATSVSRGVATARRPADRHVLHNARTTRPSAVLSDRPSTLWTWRDGDPLWCSQRNGNSRPVIYPGFGGVEPFERSTSPQRSLLEWIGSDELDLHLVAIARAIGARIGAGEWTPTSGRYSRHVRPASRRSSFSAAGSGAPSSRPRRCWATSLRIEGDLDSGAVVVFESARIRVRSLPLLS